MGTSHTHTSHNPGRHACVPRMPHSPATQLATAPRPMPLLCVAARYRDTARRKFHRHSTDTHTLPRTRQRPVPRGPPPPTPQAPRTMPRTDEHRRAQPATPSSLCFERAHLPCYESPTTSSPSAQQLRACATRTVAEILKIWPSVSSKQRSSRYGAGPGSVRVVVDAAHGHASRPADFKLSP